MRRLVAATALLLCTFGGIARARAPKVRSAPVAKRKQRGLAVIPLTHLSTHESFLLRPDRSGRITRREVKQLCHFLRCHHTGREHSMAPRLVSLLYATAHHFGDHRIYVVAGYRAPRVALAKGNPRSHHKAGEACDFKIEGIPLTALRDYLRHTFRAVGVGYYPNAGFVHLDVRPKKSAFWIDYSAPGERARYSEDPDEDARSGATRPTPLPVPAAVSPDGEQRDEDARDDKESDDRADQPMPAAAPLPLSAPTPPTPVGPSLP